MLWIYLWRPRLAATDIGDDSIESVAPRSSEAALFLVDFTLIFFEEYGDSMERIFWTLKLLPGIYIDPHKGQGIDTPSEICVIPFPF